LVASKRISFEVNAEQTEYMFWCLANKGQGKITK
jgi:hypothetical protein